MDKVLSRELKRRSTSSSPRPGKVIRVVGIGQKRISRRGSRCTQDYLAGEVTGSRGRAQEARGWWDRAHLLIAPGARQLTVEAVSGLYSSTPRELPLSVK